MTTATALNIAAAVAYELDGWEYHSDRYGNSGWHELHGPAGDVIQLRIGPHLIEARGLHEQHLGRKRSWDVAGYRNAEIGFSAAKTPARMAGEIRRRLLPIVAENNRVLDAEQELIVAETAADDALFAAGQALFPTLHWWNTGTGRRDEAVAWANGGGISIKFELDPARYDRHNNLQISNLTRAQLLAVLKTAGRLRSPGPSRRSGQKTAVRRHARRRTRARGRRPR